MGDPEAILGLLLGGIFLLTPIIFILTKHQQKMATILNQNNGAQLTTQNNDIASLKELVHQQSIAIDNLARSHQDLRTELKTQQELATRISASN